MSSNDVVLLADMIERSRKLAGSEIAPEDHHTYFAAQQYLRHYKPSHDDLLSGLVDGRHDGGVDGIYIFANSLCIRDDTPLKALGRDATLDLFLLQVKNSKGFGEDAIDKLIVNLPRILDFNRDETLLAKTINPRVIEISRRFLMAYRDLEMPRLRVFVVFASLKADQVHPGTTDKADLLAVSIRDCFGSCQPSVEFVDAGALADMARDRPSITRSLALAENPISTDTAGGYIAVVRLAEYERFITAESGELDATLFEANVRDYEGDVSVNRSIQATLEQSDADVDFWWLNNGVTVVATRVQPANKLLQLDSPQVVNGLQTSNEIYKRSRAARGVAETRSLLVKVIEAKDDDVRDRIIRATNSQTALGPSALRATDKVQRQIEEYLQTRGLFYERRRRHYQNKGIASQHLVSIDQMGQSLLSGLVQAPHVARGSLSLIFEKEYYDLLFAQSHPIAMYAASIELLRTVEAFLRSLPDTKVQIEDFVFHLTMLAAIAMTRRNKPSASDIARLESVKPTGRQLSDLLDIVQREYLARARQTGEVLLDPIAKDPAVTKALMDRGRQYLLASPRT